MHCIYRTTFSASRCYRRSLPGRYRLNVSWYTSGSLHLYERYGTCQAILKRGLSTNDTHDADDAFVENPAASIAILLEAESAIRGGGKPDETKLGHIHPYWCDLVRLLPEVFVAKRRRDEKCGQKRFAGRCRLTSISLYRPRDPTG